MFDLSSFNSYLQGIVNQLLPEPQASLLNGILLGVKEMPPELQQAFKITGTIHVVVVSGYNISVVGGFFLNLAGVIKRRYALLASMLAIVLYIMLVGAQPPVIRAGIMAAVSYLAMSLGKQRMALWSLSLAALVMVLFDFSVLGNLSFQLSFLATLGIIIFSEKFKQLFIKVPEPFNDSLATTLAAQLLVTPLIFYNFGTVSLISPLVNTLVLWTIPLATVLGFASLAVSLLVLKIGQLLALFAWVPLSIFVWVVELGAKIPLAQIELGKNSWLMMVGWYLLVAALFLWLSNRELADDQVV